MEEKIRGVVEERSLHHSTTRLDRNKKVPVCERASPRTIVDVEIIQAERNPVIVNRIDPLTLGEKHTVAAHFGVNLTLQAVWDPLIYDHRYLNYISTLQMATPAILDLIEGDGNCLFHAVSKEVLSSEQHYLEDSSL